MEKYLNRKSLYQEYLEALQARKNTYLDKHSVGDQFFAVLYDHDNNDRWLPYRFSSRILAEMARERGVEVPENYTYGQVEHARYLYGKMVEAGHMVSNTFALASIENQLFLSQVANALGIRFGERYDAFEAYEGACNLVTVEMWDLFDKCAGVDMPFWHAHEPIENVTTRWAAFFDCIQYCNKYADIQFSIMSSAWRKVCVGAVMSRLQAAAYCMKHDPVVKKFIDYTPDFSYPKFYDLLIKNRDAWEAEHGPIPEPERFTEHFASSWKHYDREYGVRVR